MEKYFFLPTVLKQFFFITVILFSCQTQQKPPIQKKPLTVASGAVQEIEPCKGMANPVMLSAAGGSDIGRLFNAYYRTGQQSKMYTLLDSQTKKSMSKDKVLQLLSKLDYGYDIKLSGATHEGPNYTLTYTCQIAQTKVIKQLKVVVENDTARLVPKDLSRGEIFD
jgi:hypothetical protein